MRRAVALVLWALVIGTTAAGGEDPGRGHRASLGVLAGAFEVAHAEYREGELGVQYRGAGEWWLLHPMLGGMATAAGAFHLYAGFGLDVSLGSRVLLRGSFAPGYYDRGGRGKDLESALEFRSSVELGWRFSDGWRLGVEWYHLSNADLGETNPGNASLLLTLTVPLGR